MALVRGDLGDSYSTGERVTARLGQRLPNSLLLFGTALLISLALGIPLGVFAATHQYSRLDMFVSVLTYIGVSIPSFVLSIFLLLLLAVFLRASPLHWGFPLFGMHGGGQDDFGDLLFHMALPVTALSIPLIATFSRFMRASMLEVLHQDYVRTGFAKNENGIWKAVATLGAPFFRSPERGARSLVWLALSDEAAPLTGEYVEDEKVVAPSARAQDDALARGLWERSAELVGLPADALA